MERFFKYYQPSLYRLNFRISKDKHKLFGQTIINGEAKSEQIKLHALNMEIKSLKLDGAVYDYDFKQGEITIYNIEPGLHEIEIEHITPIEADMQGAYLSTYMLNGEEKHVVMTQFESHYARECFPCVDEPEAKAKYRLTLTSEDTEDTLLSNMPVEHEELTERGKTAIFAETPPMSSYLLAFIAGRLVKYETKSKHGVSITAYACEHQEPSTLRLSGDFAADVLDYYDDLFGLAYPLPKLDLFAAPDFDAGAMENWGMMTFRESAMLVAENDGLDQELYVSTVVAHEVSHMWFGDLVTMKWWDDLWLNEAFANTMELYATQRVRPQYGAWDDFFTGTVQAALGRDCLPGVQSVHTDVHSVDDIDNLFDGAIVYAKGGRMVVMLMHVMGEENFFKGVHDYFVEHQYRNTVADDLWRALSKYADFDVKEFMDPWLTQSGYPVVDSKGENQHRFLLAGEGEEPNYHYPIRNFADDMSGHYLIRLTDEELAEKLAHKDELTREQKLRLLTDRHMLAKTEEVSSLSLVSLIRAFAGEVDNAIWEMLCLLISDLKIFFADESEEQARFRRFLAEIAREQYERLGNGAKEGESLSDTKLRPLIMSIMTYAKDAVYIQDIVNTYGDVEIESVSSDIRGAVATTLIRKNPELYDTYYNIYTNTNNSDLRDTLSSAIAACPDRNRLLGWMSELKDGCVRPQDRIHAIIGLLRNYLVRADMEQWVYDNWAWIEEAEGDKSISSYPRYLAKMVRTQTESDRYHAFFEPLLVKSSLSRTISVGFSDISSRLKLIANDSPALYEYFADNYKIIE